ncbi:MAG: oxidoreductase [Flavobacterium sp. BFFFF2]|nr:MAG: oxidoreductase [Flavobacterium sp. BFFFF2]
MQIAIIGGGPGGLYFSILTKKAFPECQITIYERNKPDESFGFGVVFSDETLAEFLQRDPESYERIRSAFAYWDDIVVARDGEQVSISGNGFCGCSRQTLLQLLQDRCLELGVDIQFETEMRTLPKADLIIASDGINSGIRQQFQHEFGTQITWRSNRFVWLGSTKPLDAFTYFFRNTPHGLFVAHAYQYEAGRSTWVIECSNDTWQHAGFTVTDEAGTIAQLQAIFAEELDGHDLISNKSHWRQFPHITNEHWHHQNIVLLGDAKASAHFSIGSGTKLAMDCAIGLSDAVLANRNDIPAIIAQYNQVRRPRVAAIQKAAVVSLQWFEAMDRYRSLPFETFAFAVMTRSNKLSFENLRLRDAQYAEQIVADFDQQSGLSDKNIAPAFTPFNLGSLPLENRLVMAPMGQYRACEGVVHDWHLMHYGSRATMGVGLILTEMTAVSAEGRITPGCAGIYNEEQEAAWKRIVGFVHANSAAKIGIQLGHSGRKGGLPIPETDFLPESWKSLPRKAASAIPFTSSMAVPIAMTEADMDVVCAEFVAATQRADRAGFDVVELQAHHGFLLAGFLSPLTNQRTDAYGGSIENRLRFPLRVFSAMRAVLSTEKPLIVRLSATDWAEGGITPEDVDMAVKAFIQAGAAAIDVSTGNTVSEAKMPIEPLWQVPFSDRIRNQNKVATIAAGHIQSIDAVNTILLSGKADLVAIGKPLLWNAGWVRQAQAYEQYKPAAVPPPYHKGMDTELQWAARERKEKERLKKALKPKSNRKNRDE